MLEQEVHQLNRCVKNTISSVLRKKVIEARINVPAITLHSSHNEHPEILKSFKDKRCNVDIKKLIAESTTEGQTGEKPRHHILVPRFLELCDDLDGITEFEQLFFTISLRLLLVHVRITRPPNLSKIDFSQN